MHVNVFTLNHRIFDGYNRLYMRFIALVGFGFARLMATCKMLRSWGRINHWVFQIRLGGLDWLRGFLKSKINRNARARCFNINSFMLKNNSRLADIIISTY